MGHAEMDAAATAACCAAFYEQDWVRTLLGDHFHPGGEALTRRVIADLELAPGDRVLDLACGTGTTAGVLHGGWDVQVVGLDYSHDNLARAASRVPDATFVHGSADALPFDDDTFDGVLVECAVSTFADKPAAAREIARVLKPGRRLAISDMAVYGALPADLDAFGKGWACVDDARTVEGYQALFEDAGLTTLHTADESEALREMVLALKKKLLLAGLGQLAGVLEGMDTDLPTLRDRLAQAREVVHEGRVQYARLAFSQGAWSARGASAVREACDPSTGCCP